MKKKLVGLLLIFCVINGAWAQGHVPAHDDTGSLATWLGSLEDSLAVMSDQEFADLCLTKASSYFGSESPKAIQVFSHMVDLGERSNSDLLRFKAFNARGEVYRMMGENALSAEDHEASLRFGDKFEKDLVFTYSMLSQMYMSRGEREKSSRYIDTATQIAYKYHDTSRYALLHSFRGRRFEKEELYYSALEEYQTALKYSEYVSPLPRQNLYLSISQLHGTMDENDLALEYAYGAKAVIAGLNYSLSEAFANNKIAWLLLKTDSLEKAVTYFDLVIPVYEERGRAMPLASTLSGKTIALVKQGKLDEAKASLDFATKQIEEVTLESDRTNYYLAAAKYYSANGNLGQSNDYLLKYLSVAQSQKDNLKQMTAYRSLAVNAKKIGDYKTALIYQDSVDQKMNNLDITRKRNLTYDLLAKYENVKKETEISRLSQQQAEADAKIQSRTVLGVTGLVGAILLSILSFMLYRSAKGRRKSNKLLQEKNQALETALETNKTLIKEIHHRVKNNLQIVSSLLNIQSLYEKEEGVVEAIQTGKNRIQSLSILHQNLYTNEDLEMISVRKYLTDLLDNINASFDARGKSIQIHSQIDDLQMHIDKVVSLGLLSNEIVTNSIKHGIQDEGLRIDYSLQRTPSEVVLIIKDNGPGLPYDKLPLKTKSVGVQLIRSFSQKLKAQIKIENTNGAKYIFYIPLSQIS